MIAISGNVGVPRRAMVRAVPPAPGPRHHGVLFDLSGGVTAGAAVAPEPAQAELLEELRAMHETLRDLKADIAAMAKSAVVAVENTPDGRTDDEAKAAIKAYFQSHHGQNIYPDDVADALDMDILRVIALCEALVAEGKLAHGKLSELSNPES